MRLQQTRLIEFTLSPSPTERLVCGLSITCQNEWVTLLVSQLPHHMLVDGDASSLIIRPRLLNTHCMFQITSRSLLLADLGATATLLLRLGGSATPWLDGNDRRQKRSCEPRLGLSWRWWRLAQVVFIIVAKEVRIADVGVWSICQSSRRVTST